MSWTIASVFITGFSVVIGALYYKLLVTKVNTLAHQVLVI